MDTLPPVFIGNQHTLTNTLILLPTTHSCTRWQLFEPCSAELIHSRLQTHTSMMNTQEFLTRLKPRVFHRKDLLHMKIRAIKKIRKQLFSGVSEAIKRAKRSVDIRVAFKPISTLRTHLVRVKDPTPSEKKFNVVYKIPCSVCLWSDWKTFRD